VYEGEYVADQVGRLFQILLVRSWPVCGSSPFVICIIRPSEEEGENAIRLRLWRRKGNGRRLLLMLNTLTYSSPRQVEPLKCCKAWQTCSGAAASMKASTSLKSAATSVSSQYLALHHSACAYVQNNCIEPGV
jgi:hypothetical protein